MSHFSCLISEKLFETLKLDFFCSNVTCLKIDYIYSTLIKRPSVRAPDPLIFVSSLPVLQSTLKINSIPHETIILLFEDEL